MMKMIIIVMTVAPRILPIWKWLKCPEKYNKF